MSQLRFCLLVFSSLSWMSVLGVPVALAQSSQPLTNKMAERAADKVVLGDWAIDRTEVTIGQFERYVRAT